MLKVLKHPLVRVFSADVDGEVPLEDSRASGSTSSLSARSASRCGRCTSSSYAKKSSTLDRFGIGMGLTLPPEDQLSHLPGGMGWPISSRILRRS